MTTATLGTNANNSLTALAFSVSLADVDVGTLANLILDDSRQAAVPPAASMIYPGAFAKTGLLYIPNRGILRLQPGDFVGVDHSGWPILVSADSIADASSSWSHT